MTARRQLPVLLILAAALAVSFAASRGRRGPRAQPPLPGGEGARMPSPHVFAEARERLASFRSYRMMFDERAVRAARVRDDGAVELEVDVRALARPALDRMGWADLGDAIPGNAAVRVTLSGDRVDESWWFACPAHCALDLLADSPGEDLRTPGVPGSPAATIAFRIEPERLRDLAFGARSERVLRERAELLEQIFRRPLRETLADDLTGAGVLALYRDDSGGARGLAVLELRRSDRVRSLVDLAVGLAALTRGAEVRRHRDVAIGTWTGRSGRAAAVAVDGLFLLLADDPGRVEEAIDLRRNAALAEGPASQAASLAVSGTGPFSARVTREGDGWRLVASGSRPLADNEIVRGWLRGLRRRDQRAGD